jgi:hypothetical protein
MILLLWAAAVARAGEADVLGVAIKERGSGLYQFDVTVSHADAGWEHYVDRWEVVAPDGSVLGTRTLFHPHVDEQPFTRSLVGVKLPPGVKEVTVQAHDTLHDYGGKSMSVRIP